MNIKMNRFQRATLSLTCGLMSGLLTVSAVQFGLDALQTGPRTVTFISQSATVLPEVAHRGVFGGAVAESTPAAMTAAIKAKAYGLEFDVRLTSDNRAVVIHDTTFDRTAPKCAGYGNVKDRSLKTAEKCGVTSLEDMIIHIQAQSKKYKWSGFVYIHVKVTLSSGTAKGLVNRVVPLDNETKRVVFLMEDEKNQPRLKAAKWAGRQGLMVHTAGDWALVLAKSGPFTVAVTYDATGVTPGYDATITKARADAMKALKRELWALPNEPQTRAELYALPITGLFV